MLTSLKPTWRSNTFEDDLQVSRRLLLPLNKPNVENINPEYQRPSSIIQNPFKKSLQESRRSFLENLQNTTNHSSEVDEHRKKRKISFKIKNSSAVNRRVPQSTITLNANKVQELTLKFNELIHEQPKIVKVLQRGSIKKEPKPLLRPKPIKTDLKKKPSVKRKSSVRRVQLPAEENINFRAKTNSLEGKSSVINICRNSVKETIEIFERRKSENNLIKTPEKPRIPEKRVCKTKELVIKDGVKKFRILSGEKSKTNSVQLENYFENKNLEPPSKNPCEIIEKTQEDIVDTSEDVTQNLFPKKSTCKKFYDTLKITKTTSSAQLLKMTTNEVKPNNSFLWRSRSRDYAFNIYTSIDYENNDKEIEEVKRNNQEEHVYEDTGQIIEELIEKEVEEETAGNEKTLTEELDNLYDTVGPQKLDEYKEKYEELLAKTDEILKDYKSAKILNYFANNTDNISIHSYESFCPQNDYEIPQNLDDIYETLSLKHTETPKISQKPLPLLPQSSEELYAFEPENIYSTLPSTTPKIKLEEPPNEDEGIYATVKEPYEKIKNIKTSLSYESILHPNLGVGDDGSSCGSNRGSILSCDQQSNSLYGRYAPGSDHSSGDRSSTEEWIDISDIEEEISGFVIVREKQKLNKKNSGWSNKVRDQWTKSPKKNGHLEDDALSDTYHYYESLHSDEDFDSFDSESDDENFTKINPNDSGVDMGLSQLPDPPNNSSNPGGNIYGLTRLAARLRKNWSLTKNDISKSLSRMTKKSRVPERIPPHRPPPPIPTSIPKEISLPVVQKSVQVKKSQEEAKNPLDYQNVNFSLGKMSEESKSRTLIVERNSMSRKKNWLKFRRAVSMGETSTEDPQPILQVFNPVLSQTKSTFYLPTEQEIELEVKPQVPTRRRATRPLSPPPPVPPPPVIKTAKEKIRSTSWYAECGLFKATDLPITSSEASNTTSRSSSTCWYAEVGLYQKSKNSTSSCSENSGNSTKEVKTIPQEMRKQSVVPDLIPNSRFYANSSQEEVDEYYNLQNSLKRGDKMATLLKDEPLYQFYDAAVAESAFNESSSDSEYDGYEEIGELANVKLEESVQEEKITRTSVRSRLQGCRTLWCEIPEVITSEILRTLTTTQRKLQEAKFEILTSEASYLNSLNVLTDHFFPKLTHDDLISEQDRKVLFGNIFSVKECSEKLLTDLENCWEESILLPNICNIIKIYCNEHFSVYVEYCANQSLSDAVLRRCKGETNPKTGKSPTLTRFGTTIKRLEASPICQGLSLHSFLMLPMQRVTRLPLLLDAVLRRLTPSEDDFLSCQSALRALHELATRCNEAARLTERRIELQRLQSLLEYPLGTSEVNLFAEGSKRFLVRSGDLTQLLAKGGIKQEEQGIKLTFGKRFSKLMVTVLLFEDWIIIARKKSDDSLTVLHHCPRSFLELSPPDSPPPTVDSSLLLFLTLLENQEGKQISLLLSCSSETERTRWIEALSPPQNENPNETIYESWDCPQVQAIHHYEAIQPDELSLKRGDVINIDRKMKDGWFHGEKLRDDGITGWFPGNFVMEIANPHVRARNLRQRYRLLAYTDEYLNNSLNKNN